MEVFYLSTLKVGKWLAFPRLAYSIAKGRTA
jgi:hypothetical protein